MGRHTHCQNIIFLLAALGMTLSNTLSGPKQVGQPNFILTAFSMRRP